MVILKSASDIEKMRKAGKVVGDTLKLLEDSVKIGMSTKELNDIAEKYIRKCGAVPSFLGYGGFPASVCISIDEEVVHGIPNKHKIIQDGMLISFDVGAILDGFHGDAARSVLVGTEIAEKRKLIEVTTESFYQGVAKFKEGNRLGDISHAVQAYAESFGYGVVRDLVGHGIGRDMHEDPQVPNFGIEGHGMRLKEGMALAIEPMINLGTFQVDFGDDRWTVTTRDKKASAHYENTTVLTANGVEILTL
ncbi:MAG: type I methionyl aminopeptidase [Clostridia bacterium]